MVAAAIGRRIVLGEYQPGQTLPTEPRIQEEFGVSRTAVREAIRLLSAKGLTVSRPKVGTRIRPASEWNMLDSEVLRWQMDEKPNEAFVNSLFEMREIIEPAAAARAAERATADDVGRLAEALEGIRSQARGGAEQVAADLAFHMILLEAARNPMLRSVGALIGSALEISFSLGWRTVMGDEAILQHNAVYEAVRDRKPDEAFLAMRRLLRNSKGNVLDAIWVTRGEGH
jgi:DNA-binding FadR family transcriptional regulator